MYISFQSHPIIVDTWFLISWLCSTGLASMLSSLVPASTSVVLFFFAGVRCWF